MSQKLSQSVTYWLGVVAIGLVVGLSLQFVRAWTEPAVAPPGGNVGAPVNTGGIGQVKMGPLAVNSGSDTNGDGFIDSWAANGLLVPNGNVGIGTAAPADKLTVNGNFGSTGNAFIEGNLNIGVSPHVDSGVSIYAWNDDAAYVILQGMGDDWNYAGINLNTALNTSTNKMKSWSIVHRKEGANDGKLVFAHGEGPAGPYDVGWTWSYPMTIGTNGNVGIGTTAPSQKLDVAGYVKGQSGLCIGNDCRSNWPAGGGGISNCITKTCNLSASTGDCTTPACDEGYYLTGGGLDGMYCPSYCHSYPFGQSWACKSSGGSTLSSKKCYAICCR